MISKTLSLVCCGLLLFARTSRSQDVDMEHQPFQVGAINYFGYGGLPLEKVRSVIPLHTGDTLSYATFSKKPIIDAVRGVTGKAPTDVAIIYCDDSRRLQIFIGLAGSTSRPVPVRTITPTNARLDDAGVQLYEREMEALMYSVSHGSAEEDDSQGYMVSKDPSLRAVNLAMRAYAVKHERQIRDALETADDVGQRRAAAALMGYVERSQAQADALSEAMEDPDDEVRNNAVRALAVLSSVAGGARLQINIKPLINLLYSGEWTDRNKAGFLLVQMTKSRDPQMLDTLKREAMGPLVEGASWKDDPGHSSSFRILVERIRDVR